MNGRNIIHMNEATLIEAVQEYLDARTNEKMRKQTVTAIAAYSKALDNGFDVFLESPKEEPK